MRPLRYQVGECDCGPTTFLNAISYLFDRKDISSNVIKSIYNILLDIKKETGKLTGTTRNATKELSDWLNSKETYMEISSSWYESIEVTEEFLRGNIATNSCIILRVWLVQEHYILITNIIGDDVYVFDPYFDEECQYDEGIALIHDNDKHYNRIINIKNIMSKDKTKDYAIGAVKKRECIIIRSRKYE